MIEMEQQIMTTVVQNPPTRTNFDWQAAVQDDLGRIEAKMKVASLMGTEQLDPAMQAIISAGGKRLRPAITILMGRMFDSPWEAIEAVAASIELLHTATLVHDDLIDHADARRGVPTLHTRLPLGVTVLMGDFLFAKAAALAAEANSVAIVQLFSETLVKICHGEILQAQTRWQIPTPAIYQERIYGKTAALFEAAAIAATYLSDADAGEQAAIAEFGRYLGLAFQIMDDALDFEATSEGLGKPAGNDMRQGIFNLPVMFYVEAGHLDDATLKARVSQADHLDELVADMRDTGMINKSLEVAQDYALRARRALRQTRGGDCLHYLDQITEYAIARSY